MKIPIGDVSTSGLTNILKSKGDIKSILQDIAYSITNPTLQEHLKVLLSSKGFKRQDVIKRSELDSNYVNQFFNGIKTKPGREQAISLAFGFGLDKDETDRLLKIAKVGALYPRNKRDAVLIHSLENGKTIAQANEVLVSLGLETLPGYVKCL